MASPGSTWPKLSPKLIPACVSNIHCSRPAVTCVRRGSLPALEWIQVAQVKPSSCWRAAFICAVALFD